MKSGGKATKKNGWDKTINCYYDYNNDNNNVFLAHLQNSMRLHYYKK